MKAERIINHCLPPIILKPGSGLRRCRLAAMDCFVGKSSVNLVLRYLVMEGQDKSGFSIMWMLSAPAFGSSLLNVWKEALDGWVSRSGRSDPSEFTSYSCCTTSALLSSAALSFLLKIILCVCVCVCICVFVCFSFTCNERERKEAQCRNERNYLFLSG